MMKKSVVLIALLMVAMAFIVAPVAAAGAATTTVTVTSCGEAPIIKCKWEQDDTEWLEDGDKTHVKYGPEETNSWFEPACNEPTSVFIYAVATDPDGLNDIATVNYKVTGPCGKIWKGCLAPCGDFSDVQAAENANLICWNPEYDIDDVAYELNDCSTAGVFCKEIVIGYCDPAGEYTVEVWALDIGGMQSVPLVNEFTMLRLACCQYDFSSINWGTIKLGGHQLVSGDKDMNTPNRPTVQNLGNVDINIKVKEDALQNENGVSFAKNCNDQWYYRYDAKILGQGTEKYFYPSADYELLDGYVKRCNMDGLCFSLEVLQAMPAGAYIGTAYIECVDAGLDPCPEQPCPV